MAKRIFDIVLSGLGLLFLFPIMLIIAIWIKLDSHGPIFFRQERVGRYGILFRIHKFRTMRVNSELAGRLTVGRDARITRCGHFLRKKKLDELPQLIDVFIGKMSLVGPRPEVQEFINFYPSDIRDKVLSVRPGITDRASIEMVNENDVLSKFIDSRQAYIENILPLKQDYYVDYVDNHRLITDIRIIFDTILKIIKRN